DSHGNWVPFAAQEGAYDPNRRWIDKMANHGSVVRRIQARYGVERVETFIDCCLSLENLIDPHSAFVRRSEVKKKTKDLDGDSELPQELEVPRMRSKDYMENFINPEEHMQALREKMKREADEVQRRFPEEPVQDVLKFL